MESQFTKQDCDGVFMSTVTRRLPIFIVSGLLLSFFAGVKGFAAGRYAYAPLPDLPLIKAWAEDDPERFWIQGEKSIFYYDQGTKREAQPIATGTWQILAGNLAFLYGALALPPGSEERLRGGRIRLIESKAALSFSFSIHGGIKPIRRNSALVSDKSKPPLIEGTDSPFSLGQWIDAEQWHKDVVTLSNWSRYSYGEGINESKIWLEERFRQLPNFELSEFPFAMPRGNGVNVLGTIKGKTRPNDVYIIGAHYDSISEIPRISAPGAEDNASGVAGMLAIASVFACHPPEATMIFVGFSGEEEGLFGSFAWTRNWLESGKAKTIKAALIMDMIGYSGDEELDVLLETSAITKPLLKDIHGVNTDPDLVISESFDYWGSDHQPFLDNGIPAILFIENDYLDYPYYHNSYDTAGHIHPELGPKILRLMTNSLGQWVFDARGS